MKMLQTITHEFYSSHRNGVDQVNNLWFLQEKLGIVRTLALGTVFFPAAYISGDMKYLFNRGVAYLTKRIGLKV